MNLVIIEDSSHVSNNKRKVVGYTRYKVVTLSLGGNSFEWIGIHVKINTH